MTYFSVNDHLVFAKTPDSTAAPDTDIQQVSEKFTSLHTTLHRRLRDHQLDLHPHWERESLITTRSVAGEHGTVLALHYFRSRESAQQVERLMGRDSVQTRGDVDVYRHPVIELRLSLNAFAVELIVSPFAWWDQQNFVGKMSVQRHRDAFRQLLSRLPGDLCVGFWNGAALDDMHLTAQELVYANHLSEWMGTFSDGQDWLRVGTWYAPEDPALSSDSIVGELTGRVRALYQVYAFLLWTSNNDFHPFYAKGGDRHNAVAMR